MTLGLASRRAGLALPALERAVWVVAPHAEAIEAAYPTIDAALEQRPGYPLVLSVPADQDIGRLATRYEREVVMPLPYGWAVRRFARILNPALIILLGPEGHWRAGWQRSLQAQGLFVVIFDAQCPPGPKVLAARIPELADSRAIRETFRKPRRLARFVRGSIGRHAIDLFPHRRIDSWGELRQLLGLPRTIVCLGNGPSSEAPALAGISSDALFRVNWRWRERGFLASPQLVFVGDPRTPNKLPTPIFGFRSPEDANYVLWRQCLSSRLPRFRFFIFDCLPSPVSEHPWAARPTNGAIMIATAVALRPQRLVIAGVDLYCHPLGRHPGATDAVDGYNRVHDRAVEIDIIRATVAGFSGELEILSPVLSAALAGSTRAAGVTQSSS